MSNHIAGCCQINAVAIVGDAAQLSGGKTVREMQTPRFERAADSQGAAPVFVAAAAK